MGEFSYELEEILMLLEQLVGGLNSVEGILASIVSIITVVTTGVSLVVGVIVAIFSFIYYLISYIFMAIPLFSLAKKTGSKLAWVAWFPFFCADARHLVMCDIAGNKPFEFWNGKIKFQNRKTSFLLYVIIRYFGNMLILTFIAIASVSFPIVGSISSILVLLPKIVCSIISYVYLRDILDVFNEDQHANSSNAMLITFIDALFLGGFARSFYLYSYMKRKPIIRQEVILE